MKKFLIVPLFLFLITPSIALASWWNPFTWKIFNNLFKNKNENSEIVSTPNESFDSTIDSILEPDSNSTSVSNQNLKSSTSESQEVKQSKCIKSECVFLKVPNGGETFYVGQEISAKWDSFGFDESFRKKNIYLVKKEGNNYVNLYNLGSGTDRGSYRLSPIPKGLNSGSNYLLKIVLSNANGQEAIDYSDRTFSIKSDSSSECEKPSVTIEPDTLGGGYQISSSGGKNCTVRIKKIKFKSDKKVTSWHTQFTDVTTKVDGNILTLLMDEPYLELSGALINTPIGPKVMSVSIDIYGDFSNSENNSSKAISIGTTSNPTTDSLHSSNTFVYPVGIDAVDVNGNQITDIRGLK